MDKLVGLLEERGVKATGKYERDYSSWHVSNLLESAYQISKGNAVYHEYQGRPKGIMSLGSLWEMLADVYLDWWAVERGGAYIPNVTMKKDDVIASLDGMILGTEAGMMTETKLKFSMNKDVPFRHKQQVHCYGAISGVKTVVFCILGLNTRPPEAAGRLEVYDLTERTIQETWEMVIKTKEYLVSLGLGPQ